MVAAEESFRALNYVLSSTITLMVYDWILSFSDEIKYIWAAAWSLPKVLYIVSRYYPVVYITVQCYVHNSTLTTSKRCSDYTWYHGFGGVICILPPVSAIFTLRVCALYRNTWKVMVFVWFLWIAETVGELVTTIRVTIGEHKGIITYGPGCLRISVGDPMLFLSELVAWTPALFGSLSLFILTLHRLRYLFPKYIFNFKANNPGVGENNRVLVSFVTDGTIYFFLVFVATLLSMASDLSSILVFFNEWWNPWFILIYSLSGSRLVLNLRRKAAKDSDSTTLVTSPGLQLEPLEYWRPSVNAKSMGEISN
ncbi:hypothetical protein HYPSUDRAFT_86311 [Hypholoma sublateritium FD-334 SS-4]|uniref:DUF6533 domain-containing protein n=1 Tax=Hypholoma sublateritium (strain FD-334 SS-4) TaxID=945553 RepID=A0A0D2MK24_HYPSF|nr:hypothetical protein HYPSUDRAFT_86311 [Hypholoma sublateritium FD-334 SS-4]